MDARDARRRAPAPPAGAEPRARRVLRDVDRIVAHLETHAADDIAGRVADILEPLELLQRHPLIGPPAEPPRRELVIGQGSRGYVARYRYDPLEDEVVILGVRAPREAGFAG